MFYSNWTTLLSLTKLETFFTTEYEDKGFKELEYSKTVDDKKLFEFLAIN